MDEPPKHHVLPREHREWFEQRGFTGDMDIDPFCVRMERAHHEAIHGGGLASWIGFTPETHQERARQASAALLATPPPPGWRPLDPDDELLRTLLPDEED